MYAFVYLCKKVKMILSPSTLRQNLYKLLDRVIETGIPLEIKRKGKIIRIIAPEGSDKLKNLKKRDILNCDPQDLVHIDWSAEWKM